MKHCLGVHGFENGKEYRHEIILTEEQMTHLSDNRPNKSNSTLFVAPGKFGDSPNNFVRIWIYDYPETDEDRMKMGSISIQN